MNRWSGRERSAGFSRGSHIQTSHFPLPFTLFAQFASNTEHPGEIISDCWNWKRSNISFLSPILFSYITSPSQFHQIWPIWNRIGQISFSLLEAEISEIQRRKKKRERKDAITKDKSRDMVDRRNSIPAREDGPSCSLNGRRVCETRGATPLPVHASRIVRRVSSPSPSPAARNRSRD